MRPRSCNGAYGAVTTHKPPFRSSLLPSPPSELLCYCWQAVALTRLPPPIQTPPSPPSASSAAITELGRYYQRALASSPNPPLPLPEPPPPLCASSAAITELGRYYQRAGPRAGMSSEVALAIRAHLDIAENALADSAAANGGDFASGQEGADEALMRGLFTGM